MNRIAQDAFTAMETHLAETTVELFASYGMTIARCASESEGSVAIDDDSIVAFIGYAGDNARGALVLAASKVAIEAWLVALGGDAQGADVCDTLGEFANMLLGRLKGRLLPEGFPILLSTPTTASGIGLRLTRPTHPSSLLSFAGANWTLDVRLDATFDDGFALQARADRTAAAEAGDMMLF